MTTTFSIWVQTSAAIHLQARLYNVDWHRDCAPPQKMWMESCRMRARWIEMGRVDDVGRARVVDEA